MAATARLAMEGWVIGQQLEGRGAVGSIKLTTRDSLWIQARAKVELGRAEMRTVQWDLKRWETTRSWLRWRSGGDDGE